jgi:hypothetical protein
MNLNPDESINNGDPPRINEGAATTAKNDTTEAESRKRSEPDIADEEEVGRLRTKNRTKNRTNSKRFRDRKKDYMDSLFEEKYRLGKLNNDLRAHHTRLFMKLEEALMEKEMHKRNAAAARPPVFILPLPQLGGAASSLGFLGGRLPLHDPRNSRLDDFLITDQIVRARDDIMADGVNKALENNQQQERRVKQIVSLQRSTEVKVGNQRLREQAIKIEADVVHSDPQGISEAIKIEADVVHSDPQGISEDTI